MPAIKWTKGQLLSNSAKYIINTIGSTSQLKVISSTQNDAGQYVCTATNILGTAEGVVQLSVRGQLSPSPIRLIAYNSRIYSELVNIRENVQNTQLSSIHTMGIVNNYGEAILS